MEIFVRGIFKMLYRREDDVLSKFDKPPFFFFFFIKIWGSKRGDAGGIVRKRSNKNSRGTTREDW